MRRWGIIALLVVIGVFFMSSKVLPARRENDFDDLISRASVRYGVPMSLIKAIIRTESTFNPEAVNPADPSAGLMQTTPATASAVLGYPVTVEELKNPETSINAGTKFLAHLLDKYALDDAIQMYNLGETRFRLGKRAPEYLERVRGYLTYYQRGV